MKQVCPQPIRNLPEADIRLDGVTAYLSQSNAHQNLFMTFEVDLDVPERLIELKKRPQRGHSAA